MKGFTRDKKFIPMTDYKKVTRKSRDQTTKTQGVVIRKQRDERDIDFTESDKKTALDFIRRHPDATADNLSESTDIGGINGDFEDARLEIDRILKILLKEGEITESPNNPHAEFPRYRAVSQRGSDLEFRSESVTSKEKKSLQTINSMGHNLTLSSRLWDENSFSNNDLKNLQGWINTLQKNHDTLFRKLN